MEDLKFIICWLWLQPLRKLIGLRCRMKRSLLPSPRILPLSRSFRHCYLTPIFLAPMQFRFKMHAVIATAMHKVHVNCLLGLSV